MTRTPFFISALDWLSEHDRRFREARKLAELPPTRLADMGLTRADATRAFPGRSGNRPSDRAPQTLAPGVRSGTA